jgi:hypothetical protein
MKPVFVTPFLEVFKAKFELSSDHTKRDEGEIYLVTQFCHGQGLLFVCYVYREPELNCCYLDLVGDWVEDDARELAEEFLLGLRMHLGPIQAHLGPHQYLDAEVVVPDKLRERLKLSVIDDTWNQLNANELARDGDKTPRQK